MGSLRAATKARLPGSPADHPCIGPTLPRTTRDRPSPSLTVARNVPLLFPMLVETIGAARSMGWRVHMRCAYGQREGMKRIRECIYRKQLDLDTLVCTRGPNFPLARLETRLMCPQCGSRKVAVLFEPPAIAGRAGA